ncbi:hypothetical protein D9611_005726 [Ephemerocybe angulata]|uniref:Uncharacterized protein n=1 Tax=Ephemerocybe angulata TaxID=980116 RepID=A0A8H5F4S5_9AGAR|nr:hypothetical protein D9611_005726 [Tulosesus angulatus]
MATFQVDTLLPHIPDDLTIPQFMLREMSGRPVRPRNVPFFIEDGTGRQVTYEEVHHRTSSLANALSLRWHVGYGDVVCIMSPNNITCPLSGQYKLSGESPSNPSYNTEELVYQLLTTNAKLIVAHPQCLSTAAAAAKVVGLSQTSIILLSRGAGDYANVEELVSFGAGRPENYKPVRLQPGEGRSALAFLALSSGTTGKPKAVVISHFNVIANVIQMGAHYHVNDPAPNKCRTPPGDIAMAVLPMFHIYGLVVNTHFSLFCGMVVLVVPKFNFQKFLDSIVRYRVTHLHLVPPQILLLCKQRIVKNYDLSHVKYCMSGAAPLGGELMRQVSEILPNASIGQGYGMTETCTTVAAFVADARLGRIGSAGRLMPGTVAKVVKGDGTLAKEGEEGELWVKGPSMSLCYLNNAVSTAETYVDGWVRTGDEVIIKDHEVYVVDRLKEIMKVRGFQVAPAELEAHILLHPDVADVCVVGIADEYNGEVPLAYIVPSVKALKAIGKDPVRHLDLKQTIRKHVSDAKVKYKHLAGGVEFIDAIPKNPSGKILRRVLRERARQDRKPIQSRL